MSMGTLQKSYRLHAQELHAILELQVLNLCNKCTFIYTSRPWAPAEYRRLNDMLRASSETPKHIFLYFAFFFHWKHDTILF